MTEPNRPKTHRTIDTTPKQGHMVMPREVIELTGLNQWGLVHRRVWNALLANAWGERLDDPRSDFEIPLADLRGMHESNDRIRDMLEMIQKTIVEAHVNGRVTKVQMLGMTNLDANEQADGYLRYDYPKSLVRLLRSSTMYAQLNLKVLGAFTSKYSVALYELIAARAGMNKTTEEVSVETLRGWMGIADGKLPLWTDFNRYALRNALLEVNALSPFEVTMQPIKRAKRVERVLLSWSKKSPMSPEERGAVEEVNRHREGRRQRLAGETSEIVGYHLRPTTIEKARGMNHARLDLYALEAEWREWAVTAATPIRDPDANFLAFVKRKSAAAVKRLTIG